MQYSVPPLVPILAAVSRCFLLKKMWLGNMFWAPKTRGKYLLSLFSEVQNAINFVACQLPRFIGYYHAPQIFFRHCFVSFTKKLQLPIKYKFKRQRRLNKFKPLALVIDPKPAVCWLSGVIFSHHKDRKKC